MPEGIEWKPKPWTEADRAGPDERTPDITNLIQSIVSREGWESGNAIGFVIRGKGKRVAKSFKSDPKAATKLFVRTDQDKPENKVATKPQPHLVRLFFAEPEEFKPGQRVFDIVLQGKTVAENFDIVREAGAPRATIVREFNGVMVGDSLEIDLPSRVGQSVLSGIEIVKE